MFQKAILTLILGIGIHLSYAQVVNRAPYIQRPSQTTVTVAWRRGNTSSGTLYLGTTPGVWTDTLYSPSPTKKHYFDLTGLTPNTEYFYQAYSAAPNDTFTSAIYSFYTAKADTSSPLSFLVYGDCGYNNTPQNQVKDLMQNEVVDFAIVTGDVDQNVGDNYDGIFFNVYQDILNHDCHFTTIGNHDTYADNAATYLDAFYLFHNNPSNSERYYSYTWGDAKFICLDANISYDINSPQYAWMINELKCNDKKWLFVYCHQPPWSNSWSADYYIPFSPYFLYQGNEDMRTLLVPKWEEYGVDFVLNGHSHCYQRGEHNGIQYLISGGGGASTLDFHTNSNSPNISVEIYENHYTKFIIQGNTAKYYMIDKYGVYRDSVIVTKPYVHYDPVISVTPEVCAGQNNGTASISPTGPNPPYTWVWENNLSIPSIANLTPGIHTVSVTDGKGCTRTESYTINSHPTIYTAIFSSTNVFSFCEGDSIQLLVAPGYTSYLWNTGDTTSGIYIDNGGLYSVTITDASGCTNSGNKNVVELPAPNASFNYVDHNNLIVDFSAPVNSPGTTYSWDFGDGFTETGVSSTTHYYLLAGTYNVQLIVTNGCGADTVNSQINIVFGVGINEQDEALDATVTPNPFKEQTVIRFSNPNNDTFMLNLYDIHGKIVKTTSSTSNQVIIQRNEIGSGVYVFELIGPKSRTTGRLVAE